VFDPWLCFLMRILPVLDLKYGQVVRGIAGRRSEYRPIVSCLTDSCEPAEVARAFRHRLGLTEFYLADLDAIAGSAPALDIYEVIRALGCELWVDAGVREWCQAGKLVQAGVERVVVGLETIAGPEELATILQGAGADGTVFSLDLRDGKPLGDVSRWRSQEPKAIARQAIEAGIRAIIVLDLVRIGVGAGTGTEELCGELARDYPEVEIIAGGGVRGVEDLRRLSECGVRGALVASALHDGRIGKKEIEALKTRPKR
jgi:phosphoribosylformimino-5-aminoimidazole carboxamide ribotide isomerase